MLLPSFDYHVPHSVNEAVEMWGQQPGGVYMLGGTDILPQMRAGRRRATRVIDIKRIPEIQGIREEMDGSLWVGAATPMAAVETHPAILARYPVLVECCQTVGAWPLRHRATLAGNICNASPAADTAVALLALDARILTAGPLGKRSLPISDFFKAPGHSALTEGELVTAIVLPLESSGWRGRYLRLSRRQGMDLATVGVLVAASRENGHSRHRIALGAVAPTPIRVREAEVLLDREGIPGAAAEAARLAERAASPITDVRGSADYRREMVGVLTERGLMSLN